MTITEKEKALEAFFEKQKTIIAFSGGADSSLLASAAVGAAGAEVLAVTVKTELVSDREIENARAAAEEIGICHLFIEKEMLNIPEIKSNRQNRCYACKKELLNTLLEYAAKNDFECVVEGTNYSDLLMNETGKLARPGFTFISEQKEKQNKEKTGGMSCPSRPILMTPLADLEITKEEVREIAKRRNLSAAKKPSMSCLATRFSYDSNLAPVLLKTVDIAEEMITKLGAEQIRIRCHTDTAGRNIARIEVGKGEGGVFLEEKNQEAAAALIVFLKQNGFSYVTVDLEGFRSGSMDI